MLKCMYNTKLFYYNLEKKICIPLDDITIKFSFHEFILGNVKIISQYVDDEHYNTCYMLDNNQILDSRDVIVIENNIADNNNYDMVIPNDKELLFVDFKGRFTIVQF